MRTERAFGSAVLPAAGLRPPWTRDSAPPCSAISEARHANYRLRQIWRLGYSDDCHGRLIGAGGPSGRRVRRNPARATAQSLRSPAPMIRNADCERIDVDAPDLAVLVHRSGSGTRLLAIATLLEHGGPMSAEDVAARLRAVGHELTAASILRAWRGPLPIYRDADGRLALDAHGDWFRIRRDLERASRRVPTVASIPPGEEPISLDELEEGLLSQGLRRESPAVLALAFAEATGRPVSTREVDEFFSAILVARHAVGFDTVARAFSLLGPGSREEVVEPPDFDLFRALREGLRDRLWSGTSGLAALRADQQRRSRERAREVREAHGARTARRAAIAALVLDGVVEAVAIADIGRRECAVHIGPGEVAVGARSLRAFDFVAGLRVRDVLASLDLLESFHGSAVDLAALPRAKRPGKGTRPIRLTPELLMRGTLRDEGTPPSDA